jgi:hypothetical protein
MGLPSPDDLFGGLGQELGLEGGVGHGATRSFERERAIFL